VSYVVGLILALATALLGWWAGFGRDRAFYPTVLIVVAHYYVLFAVMGQSTQALIIELIAMALFLAVAIAGFKLNPWIAVVGLAAHGMFDSIHHQLIANPGVPSWWPGFCLSYDIGLAVILGIYMIRQPRRAAAQS
jgi:hypothetical protein